MLKTADPCAPPTPLFADPLAKRMRSLAHGLICHSPVSHALCLPFYSPIFQSFLSRPPSLLCLKRYSPISHNH
jgi:hypothetical protein